MNEQLSIISVTYNAEDFIEKFIKSVLKFKTTSSELIILDNNSSDKTLEILSKYKSQLKIIKSTENLGFGRGNNKASQEAEGEYFFFLNPDTELESPIFEELINFYQEKENIGIVAPKLIMPNGNPQPSVKKLPTIWGAVQELIFGKKNSYGEYVPAGEETTKVEAVYGAAFLITKKLFRELKGFDERYFLYYEDVDFCRKLKKAGKDIYYYPTLKVKHIVGGSKSDLNKYQLNVNSSKIYHGPFKTLIFQIIFLFPRLRRHLNLS